jgi:hypothetical protein
MNIANEYKSLLTGKVATDNDEYALGLVNTIYSAQKFYMPCVTLLKEYDEEILENVRLPYSETALLTTWVENGVTGKALGLFTEGIPAPVQAGAEKVFDIHNEQNYFFVVECIFGTNHPNNRTAIPMAYTVACIEKGAAKIRCISIPNTSKLGKATEDLAQMLIQRMVQMCQLMTLKNVRVKDTKGMPKSLERKHQRNGKALPDYKVLVVDGEVWDTEYEASEPGAAKRSHLRRGHIRRLQGGNVWVRSCYVHGKAPGFVEKDYAVAV